MLPADGAEWRLCRFTCDWCRGLWDSESSQVGSTTGDRESSIFTDSRTLDFAAEILRDTDRRGVAIVLNSLTGDGFIEKSLSTLAAQGRFVEIAKRNIWTAAQLKKLQSDPITSLICGQRRISILLKFVERCKPSCRISAQVN